MPKTLEFDKEVSDQIVALKEDGSKWDEISRKMGMPPGKCMLIFNHATVSPKDKVKDASGKDVVQLRDSESLSWGVISARTGYPESTLRGMYEQETGSSTKGNRIGKGGRHPESEGKPRAKKAAAKKAAAKGKGNDNVPNWDKDSAEDIIAALELRAVKVDTGSGEEVVRVKAVKRVNKATVALVNEEGKARTIKKAAIIAVSKNKVVKG